MERAIKTRKRSYNAPRISEREVELLATLERDRQSRVSLDGIAGRYGRPRAYEIVRSLVKKGIFERIAPGVYLVHPFRSLGRTWTPTAAVVVTQMLDEPHYLGGWWAFSFHRLTPQIHASRIDAFVTKWRSTRTIANASLFFHRVNPKKLSYGIEREDVRVRISDLERTLIDALDYPSLMGSLSDSLERFQGALDAANPSTLISYAVRGSRSSTCQRLGLLLERRDASARTLAPLKRQVRQTSSVLSLWPDRPRIGHVHPSWRVVEND